jgi:hypothetical protein
MKFSESYCKPTELEPLQDYLRAVDILTINDSDKTTLKKQLRAQRVPAEKLY